MKYRSLLASASLLSIMLSGAAYAQSAQTPPPGGAGTPGSPPSTEQSRTLDEVVVTADKTGAQALQKAPEAVTVVTGAQLTAQGLRNVKDIAAYVPNVSVTQNLASASVYVRGVGTNNVNAGSDPDVTTQVDGIYIARPSAQLADFIDVKSIEILRGPQGTLYGRNAVGGVLNITSLAPSHEFGGRAEVTGGNYGLFQGSGYVTGPVGKDLYGSLAVNYLRHDDFFHNVVPGGLDVGNANRGGVKAQLRWEPTATIDATTRFDVELGDEHLETYSNSIIAPAFAPLTQSVVGSYRNVALNTPQRFKTQFDGLSEEINWRFADHWALKSITGYRNSIYKLRNDNDATELAIQDLTIRESDDQYSQEFDLNYNDARLRAVGGLYFFHDEDAQDLSVFVAPSVVTPAARSLFNAASPRIDSTSGALFAQGDYNVTEKFSVILGARYTIENKSFDQTYQRLSLNPPARLASFPGFPVAFSVSRDYYAFTPKFGLNYQVTPTAFLYGSITRGFKSGGFNYTNTSVVGASFAPEKITSYEAGAKTEWLDRRLRINLTGFYYDYTNLQVQQLLGPGVAAIGNAATADIKGVELEMIGRPTPALTLTANISGLDAKYDTFTTASVPGGLVPFVANEVCTVGATGQTCTTNASGNRLNSAPTYQGLVAADYKFQLPRNITAAAHVDYTFRGRGYFDPSNVKILSQAPYGLLNLRLGFTSPDSKWGVDLFAKNLLDEGYFVTEAASGIEPNGLAGDPRTYGVRVSRTF